MVSAEGRKQPVVTAIFLHWAPHDTRKQISYLKKEQEVCGSTARWRLDIQSHRSRSARPWDPRLVLRAGSTGSTPAASVSLGPSEELTGDEKPFCLGLRETEVGLSCGSVADSNGG